MAVVAAEIVGQLFRLSDRTAAVMITPRHEMVCIDINDALDSVRTKVIESGYSRFPMADGTLENVLGRVSVKDIVASYLTARSVDIQRTMQPALFVPASTPALAMLERFRETKAKMALVIDEFGGLMGQITDNDFVEAIVGELPSPQESLDAEVVQRGDGSWLLDGMLPLDECRDLFDIKTEYAVEGRYQTVGGLVMALLGRVPDTEDRCNSAGHRIEVVDMDGRRVDKILVVLPDRDCILGDGAQ